MSLIVYIYSIIIITDWIMHTKSDNIALLIISCNRISRSSFSSHSDITIISKQLMNTLRTTDMCSVDIMHYVGPTKPQPHTLTNNYGQSLDIVSRTSEAVTHALTSDVSWMVLNNTNSLDPVPD